MTDRYYAQPIIGKADALAQLKRQIVPGDRIYCVVRRRSTRTYQTVLDPYILLDSQAHPVGVRPFCIRGAVAAVLGYRLDLKSDGIDSPYDGAGDAPAESLARDLGHALFGDLNALSGEVL